MKKTSLILAAIAALLLTTSVVHAEENKIEPTEAPEQSAEISVTPRPTGWRKEFREERKEMRENNVQKRKELRETIKEERKEMMEENKQERENFREEWKNMTPEERLTAVPTRKAMVKENVAQKRTFWESTKTRWTDLGTSIRTGWKDLFTKWFGAK